MRDFKPRGDGTRGEGRSCTIWTSARLADLIDEAAAAEGQTVSSWIVRLAAERLGRPDLGPRRPGRPRKEDAGEP